MTDGSHSLRARAICRLVSPDQLMKTCMTPLLLQRILADLGISPCHRHHAAELGHESGSGTEETSPAYADPEQRSRERPARKALAWGPENGGQSCRRSDHPRV